MKKILKKGLAISLCLTMIFNYSFSVLADENVESSKIETTYTEAVEITESNDNIKSIEESESEEKIGEESNEEVLNEFSEEIEEADFSSSIEIEDEPIEENETSVDMVEEPEKDEVIDEQEPTLLSATASPSDIEDEEIEETEFEEKIDDEEMEATPSEIDEIIEDIESATPSEIEDSTDYFIREKVIDNIKITLTADHGVFPEDAELFVEKVEDEASEEAIEEAVEKERENNANVATSYKFDIKMFVKEEEIQPDTNKGSVKVTFTLEEKIGDCLTVNAYHLKEDAAGELTAENLEADVKTKEVTALKLANENTSNGIFESEINTNAIVTEIEAEVTGFSYYVVEFTYDNLQYVLTGDSSIKLSEILRTLAIEGNVSEVEVSNEKLFIVTKDEESDDWTVTALQAFSTQEWLEVTIDGDKYVIIVTDDADTEILFDPKTWMSKLPNNYPITELTVPASHDSGTYNIKFYGLEMLKMEIYAMINNQLGINIGEDIYNYLREHFSTLTKLLEKMATWAIETIQKASGQCQTDSITEQLNKGIRALDLRIRYENDEFYIVHGCESEGLIGILTTCNCYDKNNNRLTLNMAFSEIRSFLNEHTTEVVFISVQKEGGEYDYEIEKKIIQLERDFGFEYRFAKRDYSESVINEIRTYSPNDKNINAKESTMNRGVHELGQFRQEAVDITNAVEDWENHWSDTANMKKNHLKDAVKDHSLLGMAQSNVMVKIYKKNDPYNECAFPFSIKLVRIPVIGIPLYVEVDYHAGKLLITPKQQAAIVKPHLMNLIKEYTNSGKSSDKALGLIRLDFPSASECAIIANVNTKNTYFPAAGEMDTSDYSFVYDGIADYEVEAEEFLIKAEEEVEELNVYDYRFYINSSNSSSGGGGGSSGGSPIYDLEGNILGPGGKPNYTYDGTNPPDLTGNINVSSWNSVIGTQQVNNIKYVQNTDSFVRADNTPVVTEWVGVTTNDIGKVMWYRTDAAGKILKNQFIQIGNNTYYLDNNGIMVTGQYTINGKIYNFETAVGATEGRFLY